jgi:hypothetical protein
MTGDNSNDEGVQCDDRTDWLRTSRRSVLGGLAGAAVTGAAIGTAAADSHVDVPTVEGPITGGSVTGGPQTAAVHDYESYGYVEEEYFISGDALNESDIGDSGGWFTDSADYKTRMLVYRPTDAAAFNGTVLVEWFNVSTQTDFAVAWPNAYDYLMRNGYGVVLVSAQKVGVDDSSEDRDLVTWDPERYGDLTHPGDEYALDIFAEAVQSLRTDTLGGGDGGSDDGGSSWWGDDGGDDGSSDSDPDPMGGLSVQHVLATGQSQSSIYMDQYLTDVQPEYGNVDGFLPAAGQPEVPDDVAPVLWLNTEDESGGTFGVSDPPADSGLFTYWEVAGASHVNNWLAQWSAASRRRDFQGEDPNWDPNTAAQYGELPGADYGQCERNYFTTRYAYAAAIDALRAQVVDGTSPPSADRYERSGGEIQTDADGNALGGLRLPPIDVPVAHYDARNADCTLTGQTHRFPESDLESRYASNDDYVSQLQAAAQDAIDRGHLLQAEADELLTRAAASPVGT